MKHYAAQHYKDHQSAYMDNQRARRATPEGREQKRVLARMKYVTVKEAMERSGDSDFHVRRAIAQGHLKCKRRRGKILISESSLNQWMGLTEYTPTEDEVALMEAFKEAALIDESYLADLLWDARDYLENVTES
jgi:hypothetical protein